MNSETCSDECLVTWCHRPAAWPDSLCMDHDGWDFCDECGDYTEWGMVGGYGCSSCGYYECLKCGNGVDS